MPLGYYLTERDRAAVKKLVDVERRRYGRLTSNTPHNYDDQFGGHQGPELYIARTPVTGIPGMVDTPSDGTATGSPYYPDLALSYADCQIYRITQIHNVYELEAIESFSHTVFNIHTCDIPGLTWIIIARDKYGEWLAQPAFCNGTTDDDDTTGTATATSSSSSSSSSSSTSTGTSSCEPITLTEQDVLCEGGVLNVYSRDITLDIVNGCLTRSLGEWSLLRTAGCCDCDDDDTGTGTDVGTSSAGTSSAGTSSAGTASTSNCECTDQPDYFTARISGFGACTAFNGNWHFARVSDCYWSGSLGTATGEIAFTGRSPIVGNTVDLVLTSGVNQVFYSVKTTTTDCCQTIRVDYSEGTCGSTVPLTIDLVPNCGGTGTGTATSTLSAPTGTGVDTGTGPFPATECCPGVSIPVLLYATFHGATGGCLCFNDIPTLEMTWDSAFNRYRSEEFTLGCGSGFTARLSLDCVFGTWAISYVYSAGGHCSLPLEITSYDCATATFEARVQGGADELGVGAGGCCDSLGTYFITITE